MVIHLAFLLKPVNERLGDCLYRPPVQSPNVRLALNIQSA
jgi:hypothetical protein